MIVPKRLFKYRPINEFLFDQLCNDSVYFADPATFNDPLDCLPTFSQAGDGPQLEALRSDLVERRMGRDSDAAFKRLKLKGDGAIARRKALIARKGICAFADQLLRYGA